MQQKSCTTPKKMQLWLMSVSNRKGITVRFEDEEMAKIDELAKRYHVSSATIIRWALKALAEYVEVHQGRITLPLDFSSFYNQAEKYNAQSTGQPSCEATSQGNNPGNGSSLSIHAAGAAKTSGRKKTG
jgi:hypothetical protein